MDQLEAQLVVNELCALDLVLGDCARLILHFHLVVLGRQNLGGEVQYIGQFLSRQTMIWVHFRDPGLEQAGLNAPNRPTAVDERLRYLPDLGNVERCRNRMPIRQHEENVVGWVPSEVCLEGGKVHAIIGICSYRYMQPETAFRLLMPSDYDQVVALWRRCDGVEVAEGDDRESFTRYLVRNPGLSHAATSTDTLVGAALCGHDGRRGLVYHLAVEPEYRGRGIGKQILKRALAGLRECGIARVIILVADDNSGGQEFWLSQGFEQISGAMPLGLDLV